MNIQKIVIVDDEIGPLGIIAKRLQKENYTVTACSSAKEGIESVKNVKPELAILDIAMPDMDGYAMANIIREDSELSETYILFLTGKDLEPSGINKRLAEIGNCDFIMKPCAIEDILKKIREL